MKTINIVSTTQDNGGIQQFSIEVVRAAKGNGYNTTFFVPDIEGIVIPYDIVSITRKFRLPKGYNPMLFDEIRSQINSNTPDIIIFTSNSLQTLQLLRMGDYDCYTSLIIHDVNEHPTNYNVRLFIRRMYKSISKFVMERVCFKKVTSIMLLSQNTYKTFNFKYPRLKRKTVLMPIGAHVVTSIAERPSEINQEYSYYLFMGRIDKYKGVENLIKAYNSITQEGMPKLIIAGKGTIKKNELKIAQANENIVLINRFIKNEEMNWLFNHCICVVLPYIEASQSGVLPLAYHFGKPVITSNINGLKELVDEGSTGYTFNSINQLTKCLEKVNDKTFIDIASKATGKYVKDNMDWEKNLRHAIRTTIDLG